MKPFKSGHRRAQLVFVVFSILIILSIISIAIIAIDIDVKNQVRQEIIDGEKVSQSEQEDSNDRVSLIGKIWMYTGIFATIPFLLWVYTAYANLPALGVKDSKFSTGNAIGWFFVPVFNLFRPYQVMDEIWNGSNPNVAGDAHRTQNTSSSSALIGHWWGWFLFTLIVGIFALIISRVDLADYSDTWVGYIEYLQDFVIYRYWTIAFLSIAIVSCFTTALIVRAIDQWQEQKHRLIGEMPGE
ncbi:MAG: DUF4328 domain-containing protein [Chloroflexi bacterium]|nr:DUF4328 domain-containing protein [Chloroflexota bacterium]